MTKKERFVGRDWSNSRKEITPEGGIILATEQKNGAKSWSRRCQTRGTEAKTEEMFREKVRKGSR